MDLAPGTVVANHYRLGKPLGRGGMGEVYGAENVRTGRRVAIKLLRADVREKKNAVERFRREALAAGRIHSDYVTQVLDVEEDATHGIVLVFELLDGESLVERLKRTGPIPFAELHGIIDQSLQGLNDAHQAGVVHRDLKPSNVFLERRANGTDRVKLLDFGIAKLPRELTQETLTAAGQALGTFSFMAPEQIAKAKEVDHRADIYAMATMIFQSLTGQLPYLAKNPLVLVDMKMKTEPRRLSDATSQPIDPALDAFMVRGLARDVNQRFQSAAEALAAWRVLAPGAQSQSGVQSRPSQGNAIAQTAYSAGTPQRQQGGPSAQARPNGVRQVSTQPMPQYGGSQGAPHQQGGGQPNHPLAGTMLMPAGGPSNDATDSGSTVRVPRHEAAAHVAAAQQAQQARGYPQHGGYPQGPHQGGYSNATMGGPQHPNQGAPQSGGQHARAGFPSGGYAPVSTNPNPGSSSGAHSSSPSLGNLAQQFGVSPHAPHAPHAPQSIASHPSIASHASLPGGPRYASGLNLPNPMSAAAAHATVDDPRARGGKPAKGSKLPLALMLVIFALLSFAIVAAALQYSSTGKLL